jgi:Protein of unknown function (DUF1553)/Protein of unknown function (DUF1549)/Planctomycete cytochrome C
MTRPVSTLAVLFLGLAWTSPALAGPPSPEGLEFFEKRIRPLLSENCFKCHSAAKKQRGGLRLDSGAAILKGGDTGPAIIPGKPEKSLLLKAVGYKDADLRMPPKSKLPDSQIADLVAWVKMGAPLPADAGAATGTKIFDLEARKKHWAFQPIQVKPVPAVRNRAWARSPVDAFILAALEAKGLTPAPPADPRALLRRVTYDLTGLPPTPDEIRSFLGDNSPDAYERVVDRLLASPAYGERWARHWLDLVRFAETQGHEFDFNLPLAFEYRDYVVRALNGDVPYNQFALEHVAGDLLPTPRRHPTLGLNESVIGTGFWFLGEGKHSPVDIRAEGANRTDNQLDVFGKAFLGLTVACARCHDHKFDPISTRDYYALAGYLRSSRYAEVGIDPPGPRQQILHPLRETREKAARLAIELSAVRLEESAGSLVKSLAGGREGRAWQELLSSRPGDFASRRVALGKRLQVAGAVKGKVFTDFSRGREGWFISGEAFGNGPVRSTDVEIRPGKSSPVVRLLGPAVAHSGILGGHLRGALRSPTFTIESKYILYRVAGRGSRVRLIIDGFQIIRNPIYGGLEFRVNHGDDLRWHTQDVSMWVGDRAYIEALDESDGFVALDRILFSDQPSPPAEVEPLLLGLLADESLNTPAKLAKKAERLLREIVAQWKTGKLDNQPDATARADLLNHALAAAASSPLPRSGGERLGAGGKNGGAQLTALLEKARQIESSLPTPRSVMAMTDGTGENECVFIRGNHKSLGEEAPRRFLEVFSGKEQPAPVKGSGRLALARRMTSTADPLLPRVLVNRLWHHHFGAGIVRSVDDFGVQGQAPTHPELLDWLASEFVRQDWSLKAMHRLMVTSSTYRMASRGSEQAEEVDPENRLLHRMPVRRLEAEAIRDAILAVSGRLDRTMSGRGIMPHLTPHMQGRGRPRASGPLDGNGRRSLYINVRRNFLTPLFLAFDYPIPFTTIGRRSVSNVPAQALAMMNNPFVRQQADLWARQVLAGRGQSDRQRLDEVYEMAFGRLPDAGETTAALTFLKEQQGVGSELQAWAELCHVLFNVKEFIFVN